MFADVYAGKRVLITGHTGFKGSWLSTWLLQLGAEVAGYSLEPPSSPSNFVVLGLEKRIKHYLGDVRDRSRLKQVFEEFKPDFVFHLAAQALVRHSYKDPVTTFEVNALGTLNVLECLRTMPSIGAGIIITSDKAYRNVEWIWGYRESDMMGGEDPYSGSKGCAELISHSYLHSYFRTADSTAVATARAGNVIGGGDWAEDRIIPDCVRSWSRGEHVVLRNPRATRPWQHVLEPLSGYLWLGYHLWSRNTHAVNSSYNFGPDASVNQPVVELIRRVGTYWPNASWVVEDEGISDSPEAMLLKLCCDKALAELSWQAVLPFEETVRFTSQWYQQYYDNENADMYAFTVRQIEEYSALAGLKGLAWSSM